MSDFDIIREVHVLIYVFYQFLNSTDELVWKWQILDPHVKFYFYEKLIERRGEMRLQTMINPFLL